MIASVAVANFSTSEAIISDWEISAAHLNCFWFAQNKGRFRGCTVYRYYFERQKFHLGWLHRTECIAPTLGLHSNKVCQNKTNKLSNKYRQTFISILRKSYAKILNVITSFFFLWKFKRNTVKTINLQRDKYIYLWKWVYDSFHCSIGSGTW